MFLEVFGMYQYSFQLFRYLQASQPHFTSSALTAHALPLCLPLSHDVREASSCFDSCWNFGTFMPWGHWWPHIDDSDVDPDYVSDHEKEDEELQAENFGVLPPYPYTSFLKAGSSHAFTRYPSNTRDWLYAPRARKKRRPLHMEGKNHLLSPVKTMLILITEFTPLHPQDSDEAPHTWASPVLPLFSHNTRHHFSRVGGAYLLHLMQKSLLADRIG